MYRIKQLLGSRQQIYHTRDIALLWGITNANTLYTTITRYIDQGIFYPIYKGLYATVPIDQLDPYLLGASVIHAYTYVSTETVFSREGYIVQSVPITTFVSSVSKKFSLGGHDYVCRKLADRFLMNSSGISEHDGVFWANPERAVADMIYFNKHYFFDGSVRIHWKTVKIIQKEVGYV